MRASGNAHTLNEGAPADKLALEACEAGEELASPVLDGPGAPVLLECTGRGAVGDAVPAKTLSTKFE